MFFFMLKQKQVQNMKEYLKKRYKNSTPMITIVAVFKSVEFFKGYSKYLRIKKRDIFKMKIIIVRIKQTKLLC